MIHEDVLKLRKFYIFICDMSKYQYSMNFIS